MKTQHLRFGDMYADVPDFPGIADGMANNGEINQEYGLEQLDPEDQDVTVIVKTWNQLPDVSSPTERFF